MSMKSKILLIDDEPGTLFGFTRYLSKSGYGVTQAENLLSAEQAFLLQSFDVIIVDVNLPDGSGLNFIDKIRSQSPEIPIIVITGAGNIPMAVEAMRKGACNFLTKPVDMEGLELILQKSLEIRDIKKQHANSLRLQKTEDIWFGGSAVMKEVVEQARLAAENDCPVLITGETGSGKGVIAKWIHRQSARSRHSLVEVNCSALKGDMLARDLFGNVRGAFTSADRDRDGLLDAADRGTLFLDEIGEMDISVQTQFLKVLEEKTYRRLGDTKQQRSDFRLLCATNKHLETELQRGEFRQDLYFRINLLIIHIPPLRERMEDLPEMVHHLLKTGRTQQIGITEEALAILKAYPWPGNVRELKNVLERAVVLAQGNTLTADHFSWLKSTALPKSQCTLETLSEVEQSHIFAALERERGNVTKAAESLGISKATLYRRLKAIKENW